MKPRYNLRYLISYISTSPYVFASRLSSGTLLRELGDTAGPGMARNSGRYAIDGGRIWQRNKYIRWFWFSQGVFHIKSSIFSCEGV